MAKTTPKNETLSVLELQQGVMTFNVLGSSPLFYHRFASKAWRELLYPLGRKTKADRAQNLKHDPIEEYRESVYAHRDNDHPTRFYFPGSAFRQSMKSAALRIPGVTKTEIGQLVWIDEFNVDIYGIPSLSMMMVRMSDQARTPDVRTRLVCSQWACTLNVRFAKPLLNEKQIGNLMATAGQWMGIGDGRGEKGTFHFGSFELVGSSDKRFAAIVKNQGRAPQDKGLAAPAFFDDDSADLFAWFTEELTRRTAATEYEKPKRGRKAPASKTNGEDVIHAA